MKKLKIVSIALAIAGIMGATLLVAWFGKDQIMHSMMSVGARGFTAYVAAQVATFMLLGIAWWSIVPPGHRSLPIFVWGRMVRDAAASCLPFSQLGGFVLGARAVVLGGVPTQVATLSTVVDLTAEFVAEILFLVIGLIILLRHGAAMSLAAPIEIGMAVALITCLIAFRLQRHAAAGFAKLSRRIVGRLFTSPDESEAVSDADLTEMYGHTGRILAGTLLHLLGWFAKGFGNWIAFRLLDAPIDLAGALAIEALLHAMLAFAFMVPGFAGVQEAGYAGIGAWFGVTPEISISVSLLRRARDIAVGVPILLFWQMIEMRKLPSRKPKAT